MSNKSKRDHNFYQVTGLTSREQELLHSLHGWESEKDGKPSSFNLAYQLNVSQPSIWVYCNALQKRNLIYYDPKRRIWKLHPKVLEDIKASIGGYPKQAPPDPVPSLD